MTGSAPMLERLSGSQLVCKGVGSRRTHALIINPAPLLTRHRSHYLPAVAAPHLVCYQRRANRSLSPVVAGVQAAAVREGEQPVPLTPMMMVGKPVVSRPSAAHPEQSVQPRLRAATYHRQSVRGDLSAVATVPRV